MTHAFRHERRKRLTAQQRAKLFLDQGGRCYICGLAVRGDWEAEHPIALENGGAADQPLMVVCEPCHKPKTARDHGMAAKARAVAVAATVPRRYRRKTRPMPGSKDSGWKKPMNGPPVRREK